MSKKYFLLLASMMINGCVWAASNSPVTTPVVSSQDAPVVNPHRARDAKMRQCKADADQQQLAGDQRSAFIASCMKAK